MDGSNALEQSPTQPEESLDGIQQAVEALENVIKQLDALSGAPTTPAPGEEKPTTS